MPTVIDNFEFEAPYQKLELVVDIVEETNNDSQSARFINQFLIPTFFISFLRLKALFFNKKNKKIRTFERSIRYNLVMILVATATYIIFWSFAFELLQLIWDLFHQEINWEEFFEGVFQWQTFQVILIFFPHRLLSKQALDSFHVNSTFYSRYDLLMQEAKEIEGANVIDLQTKNEAKRMIPEMMKDMINQAGTALITLDDITPEKAQEIQQVLMANMQQFMSNFGFLDNPPIDINSSSRHQTFNQPNYSNSFTPNLLDEDEDDYGNDYD